MSACVCLRRLKVKMRGNRTLARLFLRSPPKRSLASESFDNSCEAQVSVHVNASGGMNCMNRVYRSLDECTKYVTPKQEPRTALNHVNSWSIIWGAAWHGGIPKQPHLSFRRSASQGH